MITLLHGDDIAKSRAELVRLKAAAQGKEIRFVEGKTITDEMLLQALSSSSLFGGETLVVIENLFSGLGKKIKRIETLAKTIKEEGTAVDVILWEDKEVGKTALTQLGSGITIQVFKLPVIIFQFLDSVRPHNARALLQLYRQLMETEPPELVHAMLIKRIKQLLEITNGVTSSTMQAWQITRLTNQSRSFTIDELLRLYKIVLTNDIQMKTGVGALPIQQNTELLLATL